MAMMTSYEQVIIAIFATPSTCLEGEDEGKDEHHQ